MLTDKCKRVDFIISCAGASYEDVKALGDDLPKVLKDMEAEIFGFILHDKDIKEDGTLKTAHFHVVAEFNTAKRLSTFLRVLAEKLHISTLAISVAKCRSLEGSFQYLIHKNDGDKYQYPVSDIRHNLGEDSFELLMSADCEELTIDRLIYLCKTYKRPIFVAQQIGLGRYQIYRKVIQDVFEYIYEEERRKRREQAQK